MTYRVHGLLLASDLPLPELETEPEAPGLRPPDVRIGLAVAPLPPPGRQIMSWALAGGEEWLSCAAADGGYLLRFPGLAEVFVDAAGTRILARAEPGTAGGTLRHLLLDQVLPLVLNLLGRDALHATAVLIPGGVCAFTGPAGAGKSTLAASFLEAGHPVVSDDCLALTAEAGRILAWPAYPGVRLWEDTVATLGVTGGRHGAVAHYTSKRRLTPDGRGPKFPSGPQPLARVYALVHPEGAAAATGTAPPRPERLQGREAVMELVKNTFRLDIGDGAMLARQLHFLTGVAERVPVARLRLPCSFAALPAVREAILADLAQG